MFCSVASIKVKLAVSDSFTLDARISGLTDSQSSTTFHASGLPTAPQLHKASTGSSNTDRVPQSFDALSQNTKNWGGGGGGDGSSGVLTNGPAPNAALREIEQLPNHSAFGRDNERLRQRPMSFTFENMAMDVPAPVDHRYYDGLDKSRPNYQSHLSLSAELGKLPPAMTKPFRFNDSFVGFPLRTSTSTDIYTGNHIPSNHGTGVHGFSNEGSSGMNTLRLPSMNPTEVKRYLDGVGSSLIKKKSARAEKRYLDGVGSSLIKKESIGAEKRYLDGVEKLKRKRRYLDGIGSALIKKSGLGNEKRYLDGVGSALIKKSSLQNEKRYLDGVGSALIKKSSSQNEKRYLDGIGSSLIKKNSNEEQKRYLDGVASLLMKRYSMVNTKRYLDGLASSLIKRKFRNIRNNNKRYLDGVASSLIKKDISPAYKRYMDSVASSLIKKKRYLDNVASSLIRKRSSLEQKRYLDHVANSLFKRDVHAINRNPLTEAPQNKYLEEYIASLLRSTQRQDRKRYLDGVGSSLIKRNGIPYGNANELGANSLSKRSSHMADFETEKRASEVVDDVYNVPLESEVAGADSVADGGKIAPAKADKSRKRRSVDAVLPPGANDAKSVQPNPLRARRFSGGSLQQSEISNLENKGQGHSPGFSTHDARDNREKGSNEMPTLELLGDIEDFFDKNVASPTEFHGEDSHFVDSPVYGSNRQTSETPSQSLSSNSFHGIYKPAPEIDELTRSFPELTKEIAEDMAVPSKRFRISIGRRHPSVRTRPIQMSFRQYIGAVPGGLAYKRHEYDPDITTRLPGYPRVSLQTRLRAFKARAGSDQNALHRFGHRTPKGKKLSDGSFSYPVNQGRQPTVVSTVLVPGRSPPSVESRNFLKATMGGYGRNNAQLDSSRAQSKPGSGIRVQKTRFSPASQRFPNLPKPNRLRPHKSSTNFFEFDSLAGNLIT
ncbi:pedal peptide 2 precursor [Elysia marginata]|uniref:Pedal peptide 2 n=1 Tax=Elysia marginata TaxID=1093978 RepID=A0AAV4J853_9GAST|nr:pedal peptide 2 precursor [Elysia marginata]